MILIISENNVKPVSALR